jgi:hypothetical protein
MAIDKWLFTNLTREEVERAQRTAAHQQGASGKAQDPLRFLNLSVQERARVAAHMAGQAVARQQRRDSHPDGGEGGFDVGEYAEALDQLIADLGTVRRSIDAGGPDAGVLRSALTSTARRCEQLVAQLQDESRTGLQNSYVRQRR